MKNPNSSGYGSINSGLVNGKKKTIRPHVASWILHKGPIPKGMCVCHNCPGGDNRLCVNPDHLWLGSKWQNVQDAISKGTYKSTHFKTKLTANDVATIKNLFKTGHSCKEISKQFGITYGYALLVIKGLMPLSIKDHHAPTALAI